MIGTGTATPVPRAGQLCPVCASVAFVLKEEEKGGDIYRSYRCTSCRSIFCPDHYAPVSPDYVDRVSSDLTPEVLWCQGMHKKDVFDQLFHLVEARQHPVRCTLDIGCGTGGFLAYAKSRGVAELYGFDASEAQVKVASDVSPHVRRCLTVSEYVQRIGRTPPWDLITLWDVIEHVRTPARLLEDLRPHCGPNTLIFFCTPNGISEFIKLHLRRVFSVPHSFIPWEHVLYYTPEALRLMIERCGFEVVYSTGAVCYKRPFGAFECIRRAAFALTRRTSLVPQLFVLCRRAGS